MGTAAGSAVGMITAVPIAAASATDGAIHMSRNDAVNRRDRSLLHDRLPDRPPVTDSIQTRDD
jgi:hypothetical protein